jgi:glycosyltransferase involved in cell wall biosynthesis
MRDPQASHPCVSVIVRTFNSGGSLEACLESIRRQSVAAEVVVVDSGSSDGTLALAEAEAEVLIHLTDYTPGRALNAGASKASSPLHIAISSHAVLLDNDWIARCIAHFDSPTTAAVSGQYVDSRNDPLTGPVWQTPSDLRSAPNWGYSNTAGAWRATVWSEHRFNERLMACEDKEWAARILAGDWQVVIDPSLAIDDKHRRSRGLQNYATRLANEHRSLVEADLAQPWDMADLMKGWLNTSGARSRAREMVSLDRNLSLLMRYIATRSLRR